MGNNKICFPWVRLILILVIEFLIAWLFSTLRGEYFGEIGGLVFYLIALLTISLLSFIHARKSSIKLWYVTSLIFLILSLAYTLNFVINLSKVFNAQNTNQSIISIPFSK